MLRSTIGMKQHTADFWSAFDRNLQRIKHDGESRL
jgi:hypothetical protein